MATPAVQAASCAGAATAVITTTVVVVPTADNRPAYDVYTSDSTFTSNEGKLGKDVWMFLIDHSKNQEWWEWSFRQLEAHKKNKNLDASFKSLTSAFSKDTTDGTAQSKELNKLCHYHFKNTATTTLQQTPLTDSPTVSIWKYCSPLEQAPVLIGDKEAEKYGSANLGSTKKTTLISYDSFQNSVFWELKNDWFQNQSTKPSDLFFKEFSGKDKHLKEACKKAYSTTKANSGSSAATKTNPAENDVEKYCGFKATSN